MKIQRKIFHLKVDTIGHFYLDYSFIFYIRRAKNASFQLDFFAVIFPLLYLLYYLRIDLHYVNKEKLLRLDRYEEICTILYYKCRSCSSCYFAIFTVVKLFQGQLLLHLLPSRSASDIEHATL